ncbi:MAG TPA: RagB/SusD family nutrient uptake outer membrane protein [Gemmatimonadaceae bacterium]
MTLLTTFHPRRRVASRVATVATLALVAGAACSPDRITNPNSPTATSVASNPLQALQLAANGVLVGQRNSITSYLVATGQFGRELFNITPTESRAVTYYYENFSDPTGGASSGWNDRYSTLRNIATFYTTVDLVAALTSEQRAAARGFGETLEALELSYIIGTRNNLGAVVQIFPDPADLAPFVSRDSAYSYITATLDAGYADLLAAGAAAFPFTLPAPAGTGFSGFDDPATFAQFNRALKARIQAYRASMAGDDEATYEDALTALSESFLAPLSTDRSNLTAGPAYLFGNLGTDAGNSVSAINANLYAHPSIRDDGSVSDSDLRYLAKVLPGQPLRTPADANTPTDLRLNVYESATSSIPIIDDEELVLLRAEARWFTGDPQGALDDINAVRTISGGLAARGAFVDRNDFVTELLAQRRLSLLLQGHRWIDVRRFNRLASLPLSGVNFGLTANQVIPQAECLARQRSGDPGLACPAFTPN